MTVKYITEDKSSLDEWYGVWYQCPYCSNKSIHTSFQFCPDCGHKVYRKAKPKVEKRK